MTSGISEITIAPTPGNMGAVSVGATVANGKVTYGGSVTIQTPGGSTKFAAITSTSNPAVLAADTTNPWAGTGFGYILTDAEGDQIVVGTGNSGELTYTSETTGEPATPIDAIYAAAGLGTTILTIGWEDASGTAQTATVTLNVVAFKPIAIPIYTTSPTAPTVTASGGLSKGAKIAIGASVLAVGGVGIAVAAQRGVFAGFVREASESMRHFHAGESSRRRSMRVQSILVPRSRYSKSEAEAWVRRNGYRVKKIDTTEHYYRFRQRDPREFTVERTIPLGHGGVKAVVGR